MKFRRLLPVLVLALAVSGCGKSAENAEDSAESTTEVTSETVNTEATTAADKADTTQATTAVTTQPATKAAAQSEAKAAADNSAKPSAPAVQPPKAEALGVTIKGHSIKLNTPMSAASAALGNTTDYSEAPSCNYDGLDKVFTYGDVSIYTYPHPSGDTINEIEINDASVVTDKGIAPIGKTIDEIKAVYGEPTGVEGVTYKYASGKSYTYFYADNGTVSYWGVAYEE